MHSTEPPNARTRKHESALGRIALAYPGAHEDRPWGHIAVKVKKKAFLFLAADGDGLSLTVKLVGSHMEALLLPFAEPTGYGLGKSGWVTARFGPDDDPPIGILRTWIDESYRAIAPKKLVAELDARGSARAVPASRAGSTRSPVRRASPAKARSRPKPRAR